MMEFSWFDMSDSHSMWNTTNLGGPATKNVLQVSMASVLLRVWQASLAKS